MDKVALRNFAVNAKEKMEDDIKRKLEFMGITEKGTGEETVKEDDYLKINGQEFNKKEVKQRDKIIEVLKVSEKDEDFKIPDLVILMDAEPLYLQERMIENDRQMDKIDEKPLWFHQQIRDGFLALEKDLPCEFLILNALKPAEENLSIVLDFLEKNKNLLNS